MHVCSGGHVNDINHHVHSSSSHVVELGGSPLPQLPLNILGALLPPNPPDASGMALSMDIGYWLLFIIGYWLLVVGA